MAKYRIMVVDDDADVRFVVTTLLGTEFETVQAQNGLDAIEKIERSQPDLLLVDITMPIMNGISCCRSIQKNPAFSKVPVFFLTACSAKEVREEAMSVGGRDYIEKPFNSAHLIDRIQAFFEKEKTPLVPKLFTVEEVARIDATPLGAADGDEPDEPPQSAPSAPQFGGMETERLSGGKKRLHRVFGRQKEDPRHAEPEPPRAAPKPAPDDTGVPLPPPPTPDYGRISKEFVRKPVIYGRPKGAEPEQPKPAAKPTPPPSIAAKPPAPVPTPPVERTPPAQKPVTAPPPVAQPAAAKEPSAADILAQRRMTALGKQKSGAAVKPRVLVVIDHPQQLEICHSAMKGIAEFLPLEDPVDAVELIARFQPDIVMAGIKEERYSGLQLAQMMKSNARLSHIETVFVQGPSVESKHLAAARNLSRNTVVKPPFREEDIRSAVREVMARPGFKVREKALGYGVYVSEVIKAAEAERMKGNKERERRSFMDQHVSLAKFMATELKDYREPAGYDEMKGIGAKVHSVGD